MSDFVKAIGTIESVHTHSSRTDHIIIKINVGSNTIYEVDINTGTRNNYEENQFYTMNQNTPMNYSVGISNSHLNYKSDFDLVDADFRSVSEENLSSLIMKCAKSTQKIIVYGTEYIDYNKKGIHDIHMGSTHDTKNTDGAVGFFLQNDDKTRGYLALKK